MLLRHYLAQGASKSELARQLGISRDTIHRWIRAGDLDREVDATPVRYGPRRPVPTKVDAYKPIIEARLTAYPALSAVRLLAEVRAAGYDGSYTQLKAFVRQVRQYAVNGERRSFALLRPIADAAAQNRVRELVLDAFDAYEERDAVAVNS
jgi:transposase